jgi:hypothetical protein
MRHLSSAVFSCWERSTTTFKIKGIAMAFNLLKCLGGILYLKTTAGCQMSPSIFEGEDGFYEYLLSNSLRQSSYPLVLNLFTTVPKRNLSI